MHVPNGLEPQIADAVGSAVAWFRQPKKTKQLSLRELEPNFQKFEKVPQKLNVMLQNNYLYDVFFLMILIQYKINV